MEGKCGQRFRGEECYEVFAGLGIEYGEGHRVLRWVGTGENEKGERMVVAGVEKEKGGGEREGGEYVMEPGVMDGAMQATLGLGMGWKGKGEGEGEGRGGEVRVPYAAEEVEIWGRSPEKGVVVIRERGEREEEGVEKLDIEVCDEKGEVRVRMRGVTSRKLEGGRKREEGREERRERRRRGKEKEGKEKKEEEVRLLRPVWVGEGAELGRGGEGGKRWRKRVVITCEWGEGEKAEWWKEEMEKGEEAGVEVVKLKREEAGVAERYQGYSLELLEKLQEILREGERGGSGAVGGSQGGRRKAVCGAGRDAEDGGAGEPAGEESGDPVGGEGGSGGSVGEVEGSGGSAEGEGGTEVWGRGVGEPAVGTGEGRGRRREKGGVRGRGRGRRRRKKRSVSDHGRSGGLGLIFAREIARKRRGAEIVLVGRSELSQEKEREVERSPRAGRGGGIPASGYREEGRGGGTGKGDKEEAWRNTRGGAQCGSVSGQFFAEEERGRGEGGVGGEGGRSGECR